MTRFLCLKYSQPPLKAGSTSHTRPGSNHEATKQHRARGKRERKWYICLTANPVAKTVTDTCLPQRSSTRAPMMMLASGCTCLWMMLAAAFTFCLRLARCSVHSYPVQPKSRHHNYKGVNTRNPLLRYSKGNGTGRSRPSHE